jgi:L-lactate dehydrogenase (cytochrome)
MAGASSTGRSPRRALPRIADAVGDDLTILADSGVRSGLDVVRMMALGAKGVMLGRAYIYALAAAGEKGVSHLLSLFAADMKVTMTLTGAASPDRIDASSLDEVERYIAAGRASPAQPDRAADA